MDEDELSDQLVTQMGLILAQLRFARRALEDVERSTARYSGASFSAAFAAGSRFGEPPLFHGALMVYVVNIHDLAPGQGLGGLLEGLLGGVGRLFGGFFGGLIGGTLGGFTLHIMLAQVHSIATIVDRILARIGLVGGPEVVRGQEEGQEPQSAPGSFFGMLPEIRQTVDAVTALFVAASTGPDEAARRSQAPQTEAGRNWLAILHSVERVLNNIGYIINGAIFAVVILVGAFATLVTRLDEVKFAVVDLLQFALRNVFLLRGVVLVTLYDTVAAAARLGANILAILSTAVGQILTSLFAMIGTLLDAALVALRFVSNGLQQTVDALLRWLVGTIGATLTFLGDTRIFRVIVHIIQTLPLVLPSLVFLVRGTRLSPAERRELRRAARIRIPGPSAGAGPGSVPFPTFPDISSLLVPPGTTSLLSGVVGAAATQVTTEVGNIFGAAQQGMKDIATTLGEAATSGEAGFRAGLDERLEEVRTQSARLAGALDTARAATERRPETGLEAIAAAYQRWLTGGGLTALLGTITEHFRNVPPTGPEAATSIPGRIVSETAGERPRATIEIENVVIEVTPAAPTETQPQEGAPPVQPTGALQMMEEMDELIYRGYRPHLGHPLAFA